MSKSGVGELLHLSTVYYAIKIKDMGRYMPAAIEK
jgi:hypothetical protein